MTVEELKAYPNLGQLTDEQAKGILNTLNTLASMVFEYTCHQNGILIDNQLDITEEDKTNINFAA